MNNWQELVLEELGRLKKSEARKLDGDLSMDHFDRFFKQTNKASERRAARTFFRKDTKKMDWKHYQLFGERNKIMLAVDDKHKKDGAVHIIDYYVNPKFRGKGLGGKYMREVLEKYGKAYLDVNQKNASAIAVYKRFGFKITDEYEWKSSDGSMVDKFYIMSYNCNIKEN